MSQATEEAAKHYSEKVDRTQYTVIDDKKVTRFSVPGDDQYRTKMWDSLMTDCAFYFDSPTLEQEQKMKHTLQFRYDDLLRAGWRPALQTRNDLVSWACASHNQFMTSHGAKDQLWNCESNTLLLEKYGPDYNSIKAKLGYVRGLFTD